MCTYDQEKEVRGIDGCSSRVLSLGLQTFCFECDRLSGEQAFRVFHSVLEKYIEEEAVHEVVFEVKDTVRFPW